MQYLGKFKGCAYAKFDYDPYKTYWVYFVLKVAPQRGEGEKREGVQISKNSTQNLGSHKFLVPCK